MLIYLLCDVSFASQFVRELKRFKKNLKPSKHRFFYPLFIGIHFSVWLFLVTLAIEENALGVQKNELSVCLKKAANLITFQGN